MQAIIIWIIGVAISVSTCIVWIVDIVKMITDFTLGAKVGGDYVTWGLIHLVGVFAPASWITVWWP